MLAIEFFIFFHMPEPAADFIVNVFFPGVVFGLPAFVFIAVGLVFLQQRRDDILVDGLRKKVGPDRGVVGGIGITHPLFLKDQRFGIVADVEAVFWRFAL